MAAKVEMCDDVQHQKRKEKLASDDGIHIRNIFCDDDEDEREQGCSVPH